MAQWIARVTSDHKVGGSSPSEVAFFYFFNIKNHKTIIFADIKLFFTKN